MTFAGLVLTAEAMRTREYSVPLAFFLLAVLAPRGARSPGRAALYAAILAVAMVVHGRTTLPLIAMHLPTAQYRGARALLEANGDRPILNIAEADYAARPRGYVPETVSVLRRFWDRGVRLVSVHKTHAMMRFAEAHPEILRPVFRSKINGASIFAIDQDALFSAAP